MLLRKWGTIISRLKNFTVPVTSDSALEYGVVPGGRSEDSAKVHRTVAAFCGVLRV